MTDGEDDLEPEYHEKERTQIHFKVHPGRKDKWERHVTNNPEVDSLSALVRKSVAKEVSGRYDRGEEAFDDVVEELAEMQDDMSRIMRHIEALRAENVDIEEMQDILSVSVDQIKEVVDDE